jgi:signal transduction histidine kinase
MKNISIKTKYIGFTRSKSQPNYFVKTDQKRLQQVFLNILSNAVKFTDRDGKIKLKVELITNRDD